MTRKIEEFKNSSYPDNNIDTPKYYEDIFEEEVEINEPNSKMPRLDNFDVTHHSLKLQNNNNNYQYDAFQTNNMPQTSSINGLIQPTISAFNGLMQQTTSYHGLMQQTTSFSGLMQQTGSFNDGILSLPQQQYLPNQYNQPTSLMNQNNQFQYNPDFPFALNDYGNPIQSIGDVAPSFKGRKRPRNV